MDFDGLGLVTDGDFLSIAEGIELLARGSGDMESNPLFYGQLTGSVIIKFGKALKDNLPRNKAIEIAFNHEDVKGFFREKSIEQAIIKSQEWIAHTVWLESLGNPQSMNILRLMLKRNEGCEEQHLVLMTVGRG
jgi:hypothetical protein